MTTDDSSSYDEDKGVGNQVGELAGITNKEHYSTAQHAATESGRSANTAVVWEMPVGRQPTSIDLGARLKRILTTTTCCCRSPDQR
jgi:hypothetical protein